MMIGMNIATNLQAASKPQRAREEKKGNKQTRNEEDTISRTKRRLFDVHFFFLHSSQNRYARFFPLSMFVFILVQQNNVENCLFVRSLYYFPVLKRSQLEQRCATQCKISIDKIFK